jgi:hypothetical protein
MLDVVDEHATRIARTVVARSSRIVAPILNVNT